MPPGSPASWGKVAIRRFEINGRRRSSALPCVTRVPPVINRWRASYRIKRNSPRVSDTALRSGRIFARRSAGIGAVAICQEVTGISSRASRGARLGANVPVAALVARMSARASTRPLGAVTTQREPARPKADTGVPEWSELPRATTALARPRTNASGLTWPPAGIHQPPCQASVPSFLAICSRDRSAALAPASLHCATRASARFIRPGEWAGCTQPVCSASASIFSVAMVSNTLCALSRMSATKRSPAARCCLMISTGSRRESVGITCPLLRPDAPQPGSAASSTTTSTPTRRRCKAADKPVRPAPMMTTSQLRAPASGG